MHFRMPFSIKNENAHFAESFSPLLRHINSILTFASTVKNKQQLFDKSSNVKYETQMSTAATHEHAGIL